METQTHYYRLSYQEWLAGVRFARRRNSLWMARFLASWLIPLLLFYFAVANLYNAVHEAARWPDVLRAELVFLSLLSAIVGYRIFRLRRMYKRSAMVQNEHGIALAFNEEYFICGLPGRSEGRFLWAALFDFAENERLALIYTSKKGFIVVPKHVMPPESWNIFRTLVPQRRS